MKNKLEQPNINPEQSQEPIEFYVCENGLNADIEEVLSVDEFFDRDKEDFEPNRQWYTTTVANENDKKKWIELRNEYLGCCWTPNQTEEERTENKQRIEALIEAMDNLEIN